MKLMTLHYFRSDRAIKAAVRAAVTASGVPTTPAAASALAGQIFPTMLDQRAMIAARETNMIREQFRGLEIANRRFYPVTAAERATRVAAGLGGEGSPVAVVHLDPETQRKSRDTVLPYLDPEDPAVVRRFIDDLAASASRHVKSASRDLVLDTARLNRAGWARQLTGRESCTFCALLVSRGAVYTEKTVNFQTHNHCDCTATLVLEPGDDYEGKDAAVRLNGLYRMAEGDLSRFGELIHDEIGEDHAPLAA